MLADLQTSVLPSDALKPAIKNTFFVKEQRWARSDAFVEPDDEQVALNSTADYLKDYLA